MVCLGLEPLASERLIFQDDERSAVYLFGTAQCTASGMERLSLSVRWKVSPLLSILANTKKVGCFEPYTISIKDSFGIIKTC